MTLIGDIFTMHANKWASTVEFPSLIGVPLYGFMIQYTPTVGYCSLRDLKSGSRSLAFWSKVVGMQAASASVYTSLYKIVGKAWNEELAICTIRHTR